VSVKTSEEKTAWIKCIEAMAYQYNKAKIFGISLELLQKEQNRDIPVVLDVVIKRIEEIGMDTEGIFRIPGKASKIQEIKDIINSGKNLTITDETYNVHVLAGIVKLFLRELPEPLLTFELYDPLVALSPVLKESPEKSLAEIKTRLSKLPRGNYVVLKYLTSFLLQVCSHTNNNKMTASSLSVIFGPNLLRPEKETIQHSLQVPAVNSIIEVILANYNTIFD